MSDELKSNADLLKRLLAMGEGTQTGDETKMTVGKAIADITDAVAKTGGDKGKLAAVAKEKAPMIEAVLKAIDAGKGTDEEIAFKVAKAEGAAGGDENLTKAEEILKGLQGTVAKEDVVCPKCNWKGSSDDLKDGACPECGAKVATGGEDEEKKKGFAKAKTDFQADLDVAKAKAKEDLSDDDKKKLKDRLAQLRGTPKGKDDDDLKKAADDLEEISKGFGGESDGGWGYDLNDDGSDK